MKATSRGSQDEQRQDGLDVKSVGSVSSNLGLERRSAQARGGWGSLRVHSNTVAVSVFTEGQGMGKGSFMVSLSGQQARVASSMFAWSSVVCVFVPPSVVAIEDGCFRNSAIRSVTFAARCGLRVIGKSAFQGSQLSRIEVPASVEEIDDSCFQECRYLGQVKFCQGSLLRRIGKRALAACGFKELKIPDSVRVIDDECFGIKTVGISASGNLLSSLEVIAFDEGSQLSELGQRCFYRCGFQSIVLPPNLEKCGEECFERCDLLSSVEFSNTVALPVGGPWAFSKEQIRTIVLSDELELIPSEYFSGFKNLHKLDFRLSPMLRVIGERAFSGCGFRTVDIPSSVEVLESGCFMDCSLLSVVTFGPGSRLKRIGANAFHGCVALEEFALPPGVSEIGHGAFSGCNLSMFHVNDKYTAVGGLVILNDCLIGMFQTLSCLNVPDFVEEITDSCFEDCVSIHKIAFGRWSLATRLGKRAFLGSRLEEIALPQTVTVIDDHCFEFCQLLFSVTFPKYSQLSRVGQRAFHGCSFPKIDFSFTSVLVIDDDCFSEHRSPLELSWGSDSSLIRLGKRSFFKCNIDTLTIPKSVVSIDDECFGAECGDWSTRAIHSSLQELIFEAESDLLYLGRYAFAGCNIKRLLIPSMVTTISDGCFQNCHHLAELQFAPGAILRTLGKAAFSQTQITTVHFPDTLEIVDDYCFRNCKHLATAVFQSTSRLKRLGKGSFYATSLSQISIPAHTELIDDQCFMCCTSLVTVSFASAPSIANSAFAETPFNLSGQAGHQSVKL